MPKPTRRQFIAGSISSVTAASALPDNHYRQSVLGEPSLLAYWPMDGNLLPAQGGGAGAVVPTNLRFVSGSSGGKALDVSERRFVSFGNLPDLDTPEGSVELFFQLTASPPKEFNPCLIAKRRTSAETRWSLHVMNDLTNIGIWNGRDLALAPPADGKFAVGRWYHLAITSKSDDGLKVYLDGVPCTAKSGNAPFNVAQKNHPLQVGASTPDGSEAISASISDVAIYGSALSAQAVARHVDAAGMREHRRKIERERIRIEEERVRLRASKLRKRLNDPRLFEPGEKRVYDGSSLEAIRFPLGGIGAGCIQMNGKGERAIWQIFNNFSAGFVPNSFLAVRAAAAGASPVVRLLQTSSVGPFKGFQTVKFSGEYPFGWYTFEDSEMPIRVYLEVFSPFIPGDAQASAIPCAVFRVWAEALSAGVIGASVLAVQQNAVGYDGKGAILDRRFGGYGGNRNAVEHRKALTLLQMTSGLAENDPRHGTMALACLGGAAGIANIENLADLQVGLHARDFSKENRQEAGPSPAGLTLEGGLETSLPVRGTKPTRDRSTNPKDMPKQDAAAVFVLAWHFPNANHGGEIAGWSHEGNRYAAWWKDAADVADYVATHWKRLYEGTKSYHQTLYASNLPRWLVDRVSSQTAILRTKTCFWAADDYFGAWEGCAPDTGCCAGSCTHVWHYAQAHARLFPEIARKMRTSTYGYQRPDGGLPHRHPSFEPAADGHLGDILGAYREHLTSTDGLWLQSIWPKVKRAMEYAIKNWDPDEDGALAGAQWNTLDGALGGSTTWIGSLYLSALAASETMALLQGDRVFAARCLRIRVSGARKQNETLWNGEYYIQKRDPQPRNDYGDGCEIDQLLGEWWAAQVGLETNIPADRARSALSSVLKHNFRPDFQGVAQTPRKFAADDDAGTQMIQWPKGARPTPTILYGDEVMSGFEYAAAATMIQRGMLREGLMLALAVSDRYDGRLRTELTAAPTSSWGYSGSPFGDDECGKYYARAMSAWSLLLACQGFRYDGPARSIGFLPVWMPEDHASFFTGAQGWGLFTQKRSGTRLSATIDLRWGELALRSVVLAAPSPFPQVTVRAGGKLIGTDVTVADGLATINLANEVTLRMAGKLSITIV